MMTVERQLIDLAVKDIRVAFQERLLFIGRYDIKNGPPTYKSDTFIAMEAFDTKGDEYYKEIFAKYAKGKSSTLNEASFKRVLLKLHISYRKKTFSDWDTDDDGEISCDEFVSFYKCTLDKGQFRKVALKFMKLKEQFQRETSFREK